MLARVVDHWGGSDPPWWSLLLERRAYGADEERADDEQPARQFLLFSEGWIVAVCHLRLPNTIATFSSGLPTKYARIMSPAHSPTRPVSGSVVPQPSILSQTTIFDQ